MNTILSLFTGWGYLGIVILMAIESSFIPLPSELIIPPAAYLANQGYFNIWVIIICATIGSVLGALFNYFLAKHLGAPLVHRLSRSAYAKYFLISPEKIKHAEEYFKHKGRLSTFIGRLIPGVRHLISIPAGLSKMPLLPFIGYTALGAGLWSAVLAGLGWWFGANQKLLTKHYEELSLIILSAAIVGFLIWYFKRRGYAKNKN